MIGGGAGSAPSTESAITQAQGGGTYVQSGSVGGTANAITVTTQSGSFTNSGAINGIVIISPSSTNTAATTLAVDGQTALPIDKRTTSGLVALAGGEIGASMQYLVLNTGSAFELIGSILGVTEFQSGNYTATAIDGNGDSYIFTGSTPVLTLPLSTTVPVSWHIQFYAENASVTVTPQSTDIINNGVAGATVAIPVGNFSSIFTDANGHYYVSGTNDFVWAGQANYLAWYQPDGTVHAALNLAYDGTNLTTVGKIGFIGNGFTANFSASSSSTANANYVLPPAKAAGSGYILTDAAGNGVLSWAAPSAPSLSFPLTVSGTTTSGGIPYFSSTTALTSSAALTQYGVVYGGGAGAAPATTSAGTTNQVLIGTTSAAPSWSGLSSLIDSVFSSTQGSVLYRGASAWAALGPGTSGFFLETQGSSANPTWAAASGGSGCSTGGSAGNLITANGSGGCTTDTNTSLTNGALSLGSSGTLGSITMGNATSGTMTIEPATGGLGNGIVYIPSNATSDTLVTLTASQTLTNKTLSNPTFSGTVSGAGTVPLTILATQATNTVLVNATSGSASPTAQAVSSCSAAADALIWTTNTGFGCNTSITAAAVPATGVTAGALGSTVTVNNGNWSGTGLSVANGGTGQTSTLTQYGSIYGSTTTAMASTAAGSTGQVLIATTSAAPSFGSVPVNGSSLSTGSSGVSLNVGNANTWTATQTLNGSSSTFAMIMANAAEPATINGSAISSPLAYYLNSQAVYWSTANQTANWTVNFAFSSGTSLNTAMSTGQTMTAVLCALQGSTAYYNNVVQIDGSTVTPYWQGGTAPSAGNASGYDCYSYSITKTGSATYIVLATQTQF
jgi:hypothetical protein